MRTAFHVPVLGLTLLLGCAGLQDARQERRDIEAEAQQQQSELDSIGTEAALLAIVRAEQARGQVDVLRRFATHRDPRVRREALRALALVGDPATRGTLEAGLGDPDGAVRAAAAFALSQLWAWPLAPLDRVATEGAAEAALELALEDEREDLGRGRGSLPAATAMARALGEVGGEAALETLWDLAGDTGASTPLRRAALLALGTRGRRGAILRPERVPVLAEALRGELGFPAAWAAASGDVQEEAKPPLQAALLAAFPEAGDDAAAWILRALGRCAGPEAVALWTTQLEVGDPRRRLSAARGAAAAGAAGVLIAASQDADPQVAAEALAALGGVAPDEAAWTALQPRAGLGELEEAARLRGLEGFLSEDPGERDAAILQQGEAALADERPALRAAAAELLGVHPSSAAAASLLARVPLEADPSARIALATALAARSDESAEGQLRRWLDGDDPVLGSIAAEGLGQRLDDHIAVALLAAWRDHPGPEDWERRVAILRAVAEHPTVPPSFLLEAARDPDPHVRLAAFLALSHKANRSQAGAAPLRRDPPAIDDPWFGALDAERAVITTSRGELRLLLFPRLAPATVANFVRLAEAGTFDGLLFHRVVPDFVVQSGDPTNTGWGGPGWTILAEFSPLDYLRGTVGMARSDKDTAGSQWFIALSPQPHLTGHYTAFAQLMSGWDVLDRLRVGDRVERVRIERRSRP